MKNIDANPEKCSECGRTCSTEEIRLVDGQGVCLKCLYGDVESITIRPIGFVINNKERKKSGFGTTACRESSCRTGSDVSEIRLHPGQARFMKGLADESHLTIIWHLHRAKPVKTVFRRGWDGKKVGPFASRTPDRLTPIAITDVELIEVKGTTLFVRGFDAVDGTPVLDIKVSLKSLKRNG